MTNYYFKNHIRKLDKKRVITKILLYFLLSCFLLQACDTVTGNQESGTKTKSKIQYKNVERKDSLWERVRRNFKIAKQAFRSSSTNNHPRVQHYVKQYSAQDKNLGRLNKASPYLYYIVEQLEKRNMPTELALLPMIESAYEPQATSRKGAAGLWQFIPGTGRKFGLKQDGWYDGRRDIAASTKAALDYLSLLHKEFDNNWMLALAAYNAGEGAIRRAIKRNRRAGKATNFWDLKLPKETQEYVPKILALAEVVSNPNKHAVSLPHIENKPFFVPVDPGVHLDFKKAAKLADIPVADLKRLNPGYRKQSTHPTGPKELLLPVDKAKEFEENVSKAK